MSAATAGHAYRDAVGEGPLTAPRSSCGLPCLPTGYRTVAGVTAVLRVVRLIGVLLGGAVLVPVLAVLRGTARTALVRALARAALAALGMRVTVRGVTPRPGSLLVANHVSWLDVVVLLAVAPARLVAKREVRDYPAIGALAAASGTIFLDRSQPRLLPRLVAEVAAALRAGTSVAVFPEGTTYCGAVGGRWRPAMFQAAIDARVPVVPLRVAYLADGQDTRAAAFLGEDTLWSSICRVAWLRGLTATMACSAALHPAPGADRRALARVARSTVRVPARPAV